LYSAGVSFKSSPCRETRRGRDRFRIREMKHFARIRGAAPQQGANARSNSRLPKGFTT